MIVAAAGNCVSLRWRVRVRGAVQGVGFRPFAHAIAARYGLTGFVRNDSDGVLLEIEGARHEDFLRALRQETPPLASIESIVVELVPTRGDRVFVIEKSASGKANTRIVADAATCEACLDDLFDSGSRFHLYPFVSCVHCGPRFTVTAVLPYDRARTSMSNFRMCASCSTDYDDPASRRFHAEAIACASCGPRLSLEPTQICATLQRGEIVALKGVGGYHLMCDARNEDAVREIRRRKARDSKPFAVMAANVASLAAIVDPTAAEIALLRNRAAPIVLMKAKRNLAPAVAPGLSRLGVMLPYAPVHHLLFHAAAGFPTGRDCREAPNDFILVATSANPDGEPLVVDEKDARRRLSGVADLIVGHNRDIVIRADDSVAAIVDGAPAYLRRSRGFAPEPIDLGADGPCVVGVGAHLKTTVTVTRGREAFVSQHIGDLDAVETIRFHTETTRHLLTLLDVSPERVACDLHPDFHSTRLAEEMGLPIVRVQHHAAHIAAIAAEHGASDACLGVALDGYGLGDDHGAWGGELMRLEGAHWRRLGHLKPLALPGGDRAAREPWRMGVAALSAISRLDDAARLFPQPLASKVVERLRYGKEPTTTSMGRLFDAAAALAGVCVEQRYDGEAAMRFESLVDAPRHMTDGFSLRDGVLDFAPALSFIVDERPTAREAAEYFHGALIDGCAAWIAAAARVYGETRVILAGGCMMNRALSEGVAEALRRSGLSPVFARAVPCNDGGISLGQAALARLSAKDGGVIPCA